MTDLDASESVNELRKSGGVGEEENPIHNVIYSRFVFHTRVRKPGESIPNFVRSLRSLISSCDFESENQEDFIRDRCQLMAIISTYLSHFENIS